MALIFKTTRILVVFLALLARVTLADVPQLESQTTVMSTSPEASLLSELLRVRAGEWIGFQSGESARSPYFGLAPQVYSLSKYFKMDLLFGFVAFQEANLNQQTLAIDFLGRIRWLPKERGISLALGAGGQMWMNQSTTIESCFGINSPSIKIGNNTFHIDFDFFADYLILVPPIGFTHGIRAGVTFYAP